MKNLLQYGTIFLLIYIEKWGEKMFNRFVWELYLKSGGEDIVKTFEINLSKPISFSLNYADFIKKLHSVYLPMESEIDDEYEQLNNLYKYISNHSSDFRNKTLSSKREVFLNTKH